MFEKIGAQTFPLNQCQFIVVDNGSPEVPKQDDLPDFVTLLVCDTPGSYSARNMGVRHANGELLIFTDADCLPNPDWIESHWKAYKKNGVHTINAGGVVVKKLTPGAPNNYELYDSFLGIPQERYATKRGYAVTANLAVPRAVFDIAGCFDEKRFSGGDAEFCQRALRFGARLSFVRDAVVFHPARATWKELEIKARRVKGGQICNGPFSRRASFLFKSLLYPFISIVRVVRSPLRTEDKKRILGVVLKLSAVEVSETFNLLTGKQPERR